MCVKLAEKELKLTVGKQRNCQDCVEMIAYRKQAPFSMDNHRNKNTKTFTFIWIGDVDEVTVVSSSVSKNLKCNLSSCYQSKQYGKPYNSAELQDFDPGYTMPADFTAPFLLPIYKAIFAPPNFSLKHAIHQKYCHNCPCRSWKDNLSWQNPSSIQSLSW